MPLTSITRKYVLLCEGMHDAEFFSALIEARALPNFEVASCGYARGVRPGQDGIDQLTGALEAITALSGFPAVEGILIAADNDSDGDAVFAKVAGLIGAAEIAPGRPFEAPPAPLSKGGGTPPIVVMMVPWVGVPGALDTLCLSSASARRPNIANSVDAFATAANVDDAHHWPVTKQHKMRLRSLISAAYMNDPYLSPAWVWRDRTDLVPITDSSFNQIADFLRDFPALLAT